MDDTSQTLKPWVIFAGCVLVIVVLYWAQAVLVPIALAVLLTFVLTPPVSWLERWLGRVPGCPRRGHAGVHRPRPRRVNILAKIADVRGAGSNAGICAIG
jgi:hypothetical protein